MARPTPMMTWEELFAFYRTHKLSPYHDLKVSTRSRYESILDVWQKLLRGKTSSLDYPTIKMLERALKLDGKSPGYIHQMFSVLKVALNFGRLMNVNGCRDPVDVLSHMRLPRGPSSFGAPTREQVLAIVEAADNAGHFSAATGFLIQFELTLRPVDVFGQWCKNYKPHVWRDRLVWMDGLYWSMIALDFTHIDKVITKTVKSYPYPTRFDLTHLPSIRERLETIMESPKFQDPTSGAVIVNPDTKKPYLPGERTKVFYAAQEAAGITEKILQKDLRAGAVSEAKLLGIGPGVMRDAAQHLSSATTERYSRQRDASIAQVIKARQRA